MVFLRHNCRRGKTICINLVQGVRFMSVSKYCFAVMVAICTIGSMHAGIKASMQKKCYVGDKTILALDEGILIETVKGPILIKNLRSDTNGLFFCADDVILLPKRMHVHGAQRHLTKRHTSYCLKCDPPQRFNTRREFLMHMHGGEHRRW